MKVKKNQSESPELTEQELNDLREMESFIDEKFRPRFQTQYDRFEVPGEINSGELMTVPDLAMSIPEIMHRFSSGRGAVDNGLTYHGEDGYFPDTRKMDLVEQQEALEFARERTKRLEEQVKEKRNMRVEALRKHRQKIQQLLDAQDVTPDGEKTST